jgi:hypothetical protein
VPPRVDGAFRPSELIEVRQPPVEPPVDNLQQEQHVMSVPDVVSLISDIGWPTLDEVASLPKFVHNPNNVLLRPAVGVLWAQALSFTL